MDAREQAAVAELVHLDARREASSQDEAVGLDHAHAAVDVLRAEPEALPQTLGAHRAARFGPAADQALTGVIPILDAGQRALRRVDLGLDDGVGVEQPHEPQVLGSEVETGGSVRWLVFHFGV